MAAADDSKSSGGNPVWVRLPPPAQKVRLTPDFFISTRMLAFLFGKINRFSHNQFAVGDFLYQHRTIDLELGSNRINLGKSL